MLVVTKQALRIKNVNSEVLLDWHILITKTELVSQLKLGGNEDQSYSYSYLMRDYRELLGLKKD